MTLLSTALSLCPLKELGIEPEQKKTHEGEKMFLHPPRFPRRPGCEAAQGRFSFRSMGQVTGVWPTLTDSTERKKLASSKNWVLSPCFERRPGCVLLKKKKKVKGENVFSLKPPKYLELLLLWGEERGGGGVRRGEAALRPPGCRQTSCQTYVLTHFI